MDEEATQRTASGGRPSAHPDAAELSSYAARQLPEAAAARVAAHLVGCRSCQESVSAGDPLLGVEVLGARIERFVARGGMGAVYLAREAAGARLAVKVLLPTVANHHEFVARMRSEARALMQVSHPNVVSVRGVGELPDGRPWLAMAYVEGETLSARLLQQTFNPRGVATLLAQLLAGLAACHDSGVVHRDLKPSNLLVRDTPAGPELVLIDFGLARQAGGTVITGLHSLVGSLGYLAPELFSGHDASPQSDLYAVGCIAWRLFTGQALFSDAPEGEAWRRHLESSPPLLRTALPAAPPQLEAWLARMLAKDPGGRFGTAAEAREALLAAIARHDATLLDDEDPSEAVTEPVVVRQRLGVTSAERPLARRRRGES